MYTSRKTVFIALLLAFVLIMVPGCQSNKMKQTEQDLVHVKSMKGERKKKVILIVVDSLMAQAIDKGIAAKELPAMQFLIQNGWYDKDVISSFPTMSVTIDSSLITGAYPDAHHVPGLTWYSTKEKKLINYGTGPVEVLKQGVDPVLVDALVNLNGQHLNQKQSTLYEDIDRMGLKSGSINGLIYRGTVKHHLTIPPWLDATTSLPKSITVKGPHYLALGSLSDPLDNVKELPDGVTNRFGLNNSFAVSTVNYLIKENKLPDFLYVYLPDLDQKLHKNGPSNQDGLKKLDSQIQSIFQSFGSQEEALNKAIFIIVGDSGMTEILPAEHDPVIYLPTLFHNYKIHQLGQDISEQDENVLAVNETMAYVYKLKEHRLRDLALVLSKDPRIDFISWRDKEWMYAMQGEMAEEVRFKAGGKLTDPYEQNWTVEQAADVLDLSIKDQLGKISYGEYPDVLKRLSGALHSHPGEFLVVTAKPGYELADIGSPMHRGGGGHGSIGQAESLIPLIISGTDQKPQYKRIIDLKPFILKLLAE